MLEFIGVCSNLILMDVLEWNMRGDKLGSGHLNCTGPGHSDNLGSDHQALGYNVNHQHVHHSLI